MAARSIRGPQARCNFPLPEELSAQAAEASMRAEAENAKKAGRGESGDASSSQAPPTIGYSLRGRSQAAAAAQAQQQAQLQASAAPAGSLSAAAAVPQPSSAAPEPSTSMAAEPASASAAAASSDLHPPTTAGSLTLMGGLEDPLIPSPVGALRASDIHGVMTLSDMVLPPLLLNGGSLPVVSASRPPHPHACIHESVSHTHAHTHTHTNIHPLAHIPQATGDVAGFSKASEHPAATILATLSKVSPMGGMSPGSAFPLPEWPPVGSLGKGSMAMGISPNFLHGMSLGKSADMHDLCKHLMHNGGWVKEKRGGCGLGCCLLLAQQTSQGLWGLTPDLGPTGVVPPHFLSHKLLRAQ
jgi:hypothetical protein